MRKKSKIGQDELIKFGQWLSDQRKSAALTMAQLSMHTGVSRSTILNLENGKAVGLSDTVRNSLENFFCRNNSQPTQSEDPMQNQQGHFGEWVKAQRERKHMSQTVLAAAIGVSAGSISAIESGKARAIGDKMIRKLQEFFATDQPPPYPHSIPHHERTSLSGDYTSIANALGAIASSNDFNERVRRVAEALGCSDAEAASAIFLVEIKKLKDF